MTDSWPIAFGNFRAEVRECGGGLNFLTFKDRDLVERYSGITVPERFKGDLLAPWPNRIRDGRYQIDDDIYHLELNEENRKTALHGLINKGGWEKQEQSESEISLSFNLKTSAGYPSELIFTVTYSLSEVGLKIMLTALNIGDLRVPYGVSIHPYLVANSETKVDEWILKMPTIEYMEVDPERLLPNGVTPCAGTNFDFMKGKTIGDVFIDHAFLIDSQHLDKRIEVKDTKGNGVWMTFDEESHWIQIHTADRDNGSDARSSLAVEPMTCPPDAFNSGIDVIWLERNEQHMIEWQIGALKEGEIAQ
jgi:aldose 1-epimerase